MGIGKEIEMEWKHRRDSALPYQEWLEFDPESIVQVSNAYGDKRIGQAKGFWWGYEQDMGEVSEGTIVKARCLSTPKTPKPQNPIHKPIDVSRLIDRTTERKLL